MRPSWKSCGPYRGLLFLTCCTALSLRPHCIWVCPLSAEIAAFNRLESPPSGDRVIEVPQHLIFANAEDAGQRLDRVGGAHCPAPSRPGGQGRMREGVV